jgi:transcription antitermination factor NusG
MTKIHLDPTTIGSGPSKHDAKWFAVYTATHHEKRVRDHLSRRQVEAFLPLYQAPRRWKKSAPATLELPLFPNYIFVRISVEDRVSVLGTPGIFSFVGSKQNAWELPEREIEALRQGIRERHAEPHEYLVVGQRARVKNGVLAGLEGVIVRRKNNLQIVLSLDNIMRSIAIEVDASELTLISPIPHPAVV